jgi:5'-3' exonuclease
VVPVRFSKSAKKPIWVKPEMAKSCGQKSTMGIKDFWSVIKSECPDAMATLKLSQLTGIKAAVDISIFLNKYVKTAGEIYWLDTFILLMCALKKNGIKPICIFDGPNPPPEKKEEQNRRRAEAEKKKQKIVYARKMLKKLEEDYLPNETPLSEELIAELRVLIGTKKGKKHTTNFSDIADVISSLRETVVRQERQNLPILPIYSEKAKEIITIMGFPYYQATGEAESLCASMAVHGLVDVVLSEDTDTMAYLTPYLLAKIDLAKETVVGLSIDDILYILGFTGDQFRDLCILLSCDYNDRIKGFPPGGKKRKKAVGIGAKYAFAMINEYGTLEMAEQYIVDADPLNYRRCRELFTAPPCDHITLPYSKAIDVTNLIRFIKNNNLRTKIDYITNIWKPVDIRFHKHAEYEVDFD